MYDDLAPHYREYSKGRTAYLEAIEKVIIDRTRPGVQTLMDVGAGDGFRGSRIASATRASRLILVEPSAGMLEQCKQHGGAEVWPLTAEQLDQKSESCDVITCLWNVLGHIAGHEARVRALTNIRKLLKPDGVLYIDVNNRYNARSYGYASTFGRMLYDLVFPSERNGDVTFSWKIDGKTIQANGHFFTPQEVRRLLSEAGLQIRWQTAVDYASGALVNSSLQGQLLYEVGVRPGA